MRLSRGAQTCENKLEGLESDTDREGNRGGKEVGVVVSLVVKYRLGQRGAEGRMKCHGEMWGGGSSIQSSYKSEGRLQCSLPRGYQEVAMWKKVERSGGKRRELFSSPSPMGEENK